MTESFRDPCQECAADDGPLPGPRSGVIGLGLTQVITIVSTIALGWAQWAFPHARGFFSELGGEPNTIQYAMA